MYDLILLMSKTEAEAQLKCQKLLNVIDANRDGDVSYVEFARCHIDPFIDAAFRVHHKKESADEVHG